MNMEKNRGLITRIWNWVTNFGTRHGYLVRVQITSGFVDADHAFLGRCMAGVLVHVHTANLYYFSSGYCTAYSNHMFIIVATTCLLTYLQIWWQVLLNGVD